MLSVSENPTTKDEGRCYLIPRFPLATPNTLIDAPLEFK